MLRICQQRAAEAAGLLERDAAGMVDEREFLGLLVRIFGHLIAFERMDGAEIAGPVLARDKAYTAVAHRCATADLAAASAPGADLAGLSSADGGRYVCFGGGLPLRWEGRVVGGIGVSGGTATQDAACAGAGAAVFDEAAGFGEDGT